MQYSKCVSTLTAQYLLFFYLYTTNFPWKNDWNLRRIVRDNIVGCFFDDKVK